MNEIVKQELWRSIGVFALFVIVFIGLSREFLSPSIFTVLVFPFLATFFLFLVLIAVRTKFSKGKILAMLFVGFLLVVSGTILFYLIGFVLNNFFLFLLGIIIFVYGMVKFFGK